MVESEPSATAVRRRPMHGVSIGILLLDTGFERLPGDVGHARTWPFPVQYAVVRGVAGADAAQGRLHRLLDPMVSAANDLVAMGVDGIATSCGFLAALQPALAARCPVPIATSSLLQVPMVQRLLPPGRRVGILTATRDGLTPELFAAIDIAHDLPMEAPEPGGVFLRDHRENRVRVDAHAHRRELIAAGLRLVRRHPEVGAIVSECANFPRHSAALRQATGLPVFDAVTLVTWLHGSLQAARPD